MFSQKRNYFFIVSFLFFFSVSYGQTSVPTLTPLTAENSHFKNWGVFGNFSVFEMWVITKWKRDDLKDSLEWLKKFPSIGVLKIQAGLSF